MRRSFGINRNMHMVSNVILREYRPLRGRSKFKQDNNARERGACGAGGCAYAPRTVITPPADRSVSPRPICVALPDATQWRFVSLTVASESKIHGTFRYRSVGICGPFAACDFDVYIIGHGNRVDSN